MGRAVSLISRETPRDLARTDHAGSRGTTISSGDHWPVESHDAGSSGLIVGGMSRGPEQVFRGTGGSHSWPRPFFGHHIHRQSRGDLKETHEYFGLGAFLVFPAGIPSAEPSSRRLPCVPVVAYDHGGASEILGAMLPAGLVGLKDLPRLIEVSATFLRQAPAIGICRKNSCWKPCCRVRSTCMANYLVSLVQDRPLPPVG